MPASAFNLSSSSLAEIKRAFFDAAAEGALDFMKQVLQKHPDAATWTNPVFDGELPFARDETALMTAAHSGQAGAMRLLLARGTNVNAQHSRGWTALHHAAWQGHEEAVDVLLWHRANPALTNEGGSTAASLAFQRTHNAIGRKITGASRAYSLDEFRHGLKKPLSAPKTAKFGR